MKLAALSCSLFINLVSCNGGPLQIPIQKLPFAYGEKPHYSCKSFRAIICFFRAYLDVKLAAVSCSLLNIEAAAAIEAIDGAVAMELASVLASIVSSVLMLCLAVSML